MTGKVGEIINNNKGTPMKIVTYKNSENIEVEFLDDFHYVKPTTYINFVRGQVKNPYDRTVFNIGYLGAGKRKMQYPDTKTNTRTYMSWKNMLDRCYGKQNRNLHPAYFEIAEVCNEWLNFQTFADWYEEKEYKVDGRLHLDKDILFPGNKTYSPDKCLLVPQRINMLFLNKPNNRGLPNGINRCAKGYSAKYNEEKLGVFSTLEEAYLIYTQKKKEAILNVANEYKDIIPSYVYDAVASYEFKIENDKNYIAA